MTEHTQEINQFKPDVQLNIGERLKLASIMTAGSIVMLAAGVTFINSIITIVEPVFDSSKDVEPLKFVASAFNASIFAPRVLHVGFKMAANNTPSRKRYDKYINQPDSQPQKN